MEYHIVKIGKLTSKIHEVVQPSQIINSQS